MIEYPIIEPTSRGFKVRISQGACLSGVYTNYLLAQRAVARHLGKKEMVKASKRKK